MNHYEMELKKACHYKDLLHSCLTDELLADGLKIARCMLDVWENKMQLFICGNGGSAANALHIANDLIYGIGACGSSQKRAGMNVEALTANSGVITCLANDIGYENIFAYQLECKAKKNDMLLCLSGSGNSANIINAIKKGNEMGLVTCAILGFSGGEAKQLSRITAHSNCEDMQIAEDTQLIIGHLCMQWLTCNKPTH